MRSGTWPRCCRRHERSGEGVGRAVPCRVVKPRHGEEHVERDLGGVPARTPGGAPLRVRVAAKINPFLAVRGRRDDGMHEVVTVLQAIAIHDELAGQFSGPPAALHHPAGRRPMTVALDDDPDPGIPVEDNLVLRAARRLLERFGPVLTVADAAATPPTTRLRLDKRIPVAAGMGGGSADAAAALVLLNELWRLGLGTRALARVGAELGADVPFCLAGGTALGTGTGTDVVSLLCRGSFHWVVCIDDRPLLTADVYRAWDEVGEPGGAEPDAVIEALAAGDAQALGAALHNDLEAAALHLRPALRGVADRLRDAGALGVVVSGSGPTVLGLAGSQPHARMIAARVARHVARVEVARSPAGGPQLMRGDGRP